MTATSELRWHEAEKEYGEIAQTSCLTVRSPMFKIMPFDCCCIALPSPAQALYANPCALGFV